jgi:hypothetical protein
MDMETQYITLYSPEIHQATNNEFEEAFYNATLQYSLRNIILVEQISQEKMLEALEKSLQICSLAGIDSKHHFKQIYISDIDIQTLYVDWLMSKKGVNLIVMQIPLLNEKMARWLWELADL